MALALLYSGSAQAMTAPAGSSDQLTVSVTGHISAKCNVIQSGPSNASFGTLTDVKTGRAAQTTLDLPFSMACNAPYTATLVSKNGGLAFEGAAATGFSNLITYQAHLGLGARVGAAELNCDSRQMGGAAPSTNDKQGSATSLCSASSTTEGYSSGAGRVKLTVRGGGQPLLAGVYSDQLTLLLSPSVSGNEG